MDPEFETDMEKIAKYREEFAGYNNKRKKFFQAYFKLWHRFEVKGVDKIPDGPALVATNQVARPRIAEILARHVKVPLEEPEVETKDPRRE